MPERYSDRIRGYCEVNGIDVPIGFQRSGANRYAIIDLSGSPKLIARTWFNQADVIYYIEHLAGDGPRRILDFKDGVKLLYTGGARLRRGERF